mgnify:CR=1 FL=1
MDLKEIRREIDATDDEILRLFLKRMDLCVGVAKYKKENNIQNKQCNIVCYGNMYIYAIIWNAALLQS